MTRKKTYEEKIADHIASIVEDRNIEDVLHFTLIEHLPGILEHGLRGRSFLEQADYNVYACDDVRRDGEHEAISVSISCYYPDMFAGRRYHLRQKCAEMFWESKPWVILVLHPSLLWNYPCRFYSSGVTTNAMKYEHGNRYGGYALEKLFKDCSISGTTGAGFREEYSVPPGWPTLPDSEVQVMSPIHPNYLLRAWVETPEHGEDVREKFDAYGRSECGVEVRSFEPRIKGKGYSWG